jgi:flagellar biosynthesis protein
MAQPQPTHVVALAYHEGLYAPKVVAKGSGAIAEEILRRAAEAGVYVHQSADLVNLLMRIDLDDHIPEALYLAVAEVLAWIRRLEQPAQPFINTDNAS